MTNFKTLPCRDCGKEVDVGDESTGCVCSDFTQKNYEEYMEKTDEERDKIIEKEENMAKETITSKRIENATKVLEFIKTLGVEEKEITKILSRTSRIYKDSREENKKE